ncbi:M15 family metallopeptidase [Cellulosimicrobium terreum]|nr:M15 family metallopeptidase [Cellulosimicrobium terreum]
MSRGARRRRVARRVYGGFVVVGLVASAVAVVELVAGPDGVTAARATTAGSSSGTAQDPVRPTPAHELDPELERRFEEAQEAAAAEGVELTVTSGWRTAGEQQELVDAALERYGSADEAHRWVLPPETSEHVAGLAIDVGPTEGALWLQQHGPQHGLCQTYANEMWHFEAATEPGGTCPPMHDDASHGW